MSSSSPHCHYSKLDLVAFINLNHRTDKKDEIIKEFIRVGIPSNKTIRWEATNVPEFGALGCTMSHIALLEHVLKELPEVKTLLVLEDDFNFNEDAALVKESLEKFLNYPPDEWKLALLAYEINDRQDYNEFVSIALLAFGTAGYLINREAIPEFLENYKSSCEKLRRTHLTHLYALDVYRWHIFEETRKCFYFNKPLGYQRKSRNDIGNTLKDRADSKVQMRDQAFIGAHKAF